MQLVCIGPNPFHPSSPRNQNLYMQQKRVGMFVLLCRFETVNHRNNSSLWILQPARPMAWPSASLIIEIQQICDSTPFSIRDAYSQNGSLVVSTLACGKGSQLSDDDGNAVDDDEKINTYYRPTLHSSIIKHYHVVMQALCKDPLI